MIASASIMAFMAFRSSQKISSLIKILNRIDSANQVTAATIARELDLSERTICRYLADLQQAGYPIFFDRSRRSYRFVEGYHFKRLQEQTHDLGLDLDLKSRMIDSTSIGMLAYDDTGQCIICNDAICHLLGEPRKAVLAQNYRAAVWWQQSGLVNVAGEVMTGGRRASGDFHVRTASGDCWVFVEMSRFERNGRFYLTVVVHAFASTRRRKRRHMLPRTEKGT